MALSRARTSRTEYFLIPFNVSAATDEAIRRDALSEGKLKQLIGSIPATRKLPRNSLANSSIRWASAAISRKTSKAIDQTPR